MLERLLRVNNERYFWAGYTRQFYGTDFMTSKGYYGVISMV